MKAQATHSADCQAYVEPESITKLGGVYYAIGVTTRGHVELAHGLVLESRGIISWELAKSGETCESPW